ncbi:MAG: hypothetical protein AAGA78_00670 [Pseudomonadota bacterium]
MLISLLTYATLAYVALVLLVIPPARWLPVLMGLSGLMVPIAFASAILSPGIYFTATSMFHDLWVAMDAFSRVQAGHRPHVDFPSPLGPVYYWVKAAALWIEPLTIRSIVWASVLFTALALIFTLVLLARVLPWPALALVATLVVTTGLSVRDLDAILFVQPASYLAPYNRWGWALMVPVALRLALPARKGDPLGAVAIGLAIALLLMLKVSYGALALALLVCGAPLRGWLGLREAGWALFGLVSSLALAASLGTPLGAYLADLQSTAALQSSLAFRVAKTVSILGETGFYLIIGATFLYLMTHQGQSRWAWLRAQAVPLILMAGVALAGTLALANNHFSVEPVICFALPLIAWVWGRQAPDHRPLPPLAGLVLVALAAQRPLIDTAQLVTQPILWHVTEPDTLLEDTPYGPVKFANVATGLHQEYRFRGCRTATCRTYVGLREGLEHLANPAGQGAGPGAVLALNFANPFPSMLGEVPPRHAPLWFDYGRTFSDTHHVSPEHLLKDVTRVLLTTGDLNIAKIYEPYLQTHFELVEESPSWRFYVRAAVP